ncbi:MAG: VWA domain-containing protein, partial [Candidatus Methylomirabilis sp.]|nr:VWA domain-containing protein [Deltaproteobacteria bacterium]
SSALRHLALAPAVLRVTALALFAAALARPQLVHRSEEVLTKGIDIVLTLDISGSMKAEDFQPLNRLNVAKDVIAQFVRARRNDRLALVVFAGEAFTQVPLTLDYDMLVQVLDEVKMGYIPDGTAIGMGIAESAERLRKSDAKSKVVILLTDGENNKGAIDPKTAAEMARALGVKVYTIGVGKEGGAPIPIEGFFGTKTYLRNPDGSVYLTQLNDEALTEIAERTGATYFRATDAAGLRSIYATIDKLEKSEIKTKRFEEYTEVFGWLLGPALLLLATEALLANTRLLKAP